MKRYIIALFYILLMIICSHVFGVTLVFQEKGGDYSKTVDIFPKENGFNIIINNYGNIKSKCITDENFAVTKWDYVDCENDRKLSAYRINGRIMLACHEKGTFFEKEYEIGEYAWFQEWSFGLGRFALSQEEELHFYSISPENLMMGELKAVKKGIEQILIDGKPVEAIHIKVTISGVLASMFSGDFWFRAKDGRELRNKMPRKFFTSPIVIELVEEKNIEDCHKKRGEFGTGF